MASGAADGLFRYVFEGCISSSDMEIERRPYHKNCSCALHKSKHSCCKGSPKQTKISYPMRRVQSENCLVWAASNGSSPSSSPANNLSSSGGIRRTQSRVFKEEECDL